MKGSTPHAFTSDLFSKRNLNLSFSTNIESFRTRPQTRSFERSAFKSNEMGTARCPGCSCCLIESNDKVSHTGQVCLWKWKWIWGKPVSQVLAAGAKKYSFSTKLWWCEQFCLKMLSTLHRAVFLRFVFFWRCPKNQTDCKTSRKTMKSRTLRTGLMIEFIDTEACWRNFMSAVFKK